MPETGDFFVLAFSRFVDLRTIHGNVDQKDINKPIIVNAIRLL